MGILLVGDSALNVQYLKEYMTDKGIQEDIITCSSGSSALDIATSCQLKLAIAHHSSEDGLDGLSLLKRVKELNPGVYTLYIGKEAESKEIPYFLADYIDDMVTNPLHLDFRLNKAFNNFPQNLAAVPGPVAMNQEEYYQVIGRRSASRKGVIRRAKKKKDWKLACLVKILGNALLVLLAVILAVMAIFMVHGRVTGNRTTIAGYQVYSVVSGSMSPAVNTGSMIFVRSLDPTDIRVGDVITFRGASSDSLTTHRVVGIQNQDGLQFVTRGDANNVNDPSPVPAERIVGRMHWSIPYLGYLVGFAQTRLGLFLMVFIPGLLVVCFEAFNLYRYWNEAKRVKAAKRKRRMGSYHMPGAYS